MKFTSTLKLLIAACVVGAIVWFLEHNFQSTDRKKAESIRLLTSPSTENVSSVVVERDKLRIVCKKNGDTWRIVEPITAMADASTIEKLLGSIDASIREEVITEQQRRERKLSLRDYGFDAPRAIIKLGDGLHTCEITVGSDAPLGESLYVKLASEDDIVATSKGILLALPEKLDAIRDTLLIHGDLQRTVRVEIQNNAGGFIQLVPKGDRWFIQQPELARANTKWITTTLMALYSTKIRRFIAEPVLDAAAQPVSTLATGTVPGSGSSTEQYGLTPEQASARITVWLQGEQIGHTLIFGKQTPDVPDEVFAKSSDNASIYSVGRDILELLGVSLNDLKDRQLLQASPSHIRGFTVVEGDRRTTLYRDPQSGWMMLEPERCKADDQYVDDFVNTITRLKISGFVDQAKATNLAAVALDPFWYSINFDFMPDAARDINTNRLLIGAAAEGSSSLSCKFDNDPAVYDVASEQLLRFAPHPADPIKCRNRTMLAVDPDRVRTITVSRSGIKQIAARAAPTSPWLTVSGSSNVVNQTVVEDILFHVANLRALRIEDTTPRNASVYGLDRSGTSLTLSLDGEEGIQKTLILGFLAKTDGIYAMVQGQNVVFVLPLDVAARLTPDLTPPSETEAAPGATSP